MSTYFIEGNNLRHYFSSGTALAETTKDMIPFTVNEHPGFLVQEETHLRHFEKKIASIGTSLEYLPTHLVGIVQLKIRGPVPTSLELDPEPEFEPEPEKTPKVSLRDIARSVAVSGNKSFEETTRLLEQNDSAIADHQQAIAQLQSESMSLGIKMEFAKQAVEQNVKGIERKISEIYTLQFVRQLEFDQPCVLKITTNPLKLKKHNNLELGVLTILIDLSSLVVQIENKTQCRIHNKTAWHAPNVGSDGLTNPMIFPALYGLLSSLEIAQALSLIVNTIEDFDPQNEIEAEIMEKWSV